MAIVSLVTVSVAQAQIPEVKLKANVNVNASASTSTSTKDRGNATSSAVKKDHASTTSDTRSDVSTFVQKLLSVADRDGGIGSEVRVIAQSQNDSASTTASAMTKVNERSSLKTFLAGTDYKNLGAIRSEIATTSANIARLKALLDRTTDATVKAELTLEIEALEDEQARAEAFIETNESKFSLFGWFNKLFVK